VLAAGVPEAQPQFARLARFAMGYEETLPKFGVGMVLAVTSASLEFAVARVRQHGYVVGNAPFEQSIQFAVERRIPGGLVLAHSSITRIPLPSRHWAYRAWTQLYVVSCGPITGRWINLDSFGSVVQPRIFDQFHSRIRRRAGQKIAIR